MDAKNLPKGAPDRDDLPILNLLLGAGASLGIRIPGTTDLTKELLKLQHPSVHIPFEEYISSTGELVKGDPTQFSALRLLARGLSGTYDNPNFELMLHAVESLQGLSAVQTFDEELRDVRPVLSAFTDITPRWSELLNFGLLTELRRAMLKRLVEAIAQAQDRSVGSAGEATNRQDHQDFFMRLRSSFAVRVFTLNYDLTVDRIGSWEDGYRDGNTEGAEFSRKRFLDASQKARHILCHLHGSVLYGYKKRQEGIVKYATVKEALASYSARRSPKPDVSGELFEAAPIISGLRKLDKLNSTPYAYYFNAFSNSLLDSPRLLIVGYGFNDSHINYWIGQHRARHAERRRVAVVSRQRLERYDGGKPTNHRIVFRKGQAALRQQTGAYDGIEANTELLNAYQGFPLQFSHSEAVRLFLEGEFPLRSRKANAVGAAR